MNARSRIAHNRSASYALSLALLLPATIAGAAVAPKSTTVHATLSEWKITLTPREVSPGPVVLEVTNAGTIPHALEIEGRGVEKSTPRIEPGASATLTLSLRSGTYEAYCPVGKGSHKMLGMKSSLSVGSGERKPASHTGAMHAVGYGEMDHGAMGQEGTAGDTGGPKMMKVAGGGPVIQILPGPFPFADSAMAVIRARPPDQ